MSPPHNILWLVNTRAILTSDWSVIESDKLIYGDIEIIIGDAWTDIGMDESYVTTVYYISDTYI